MNHTKALRRTVPGLIAAAGLERPAAEAILNAGRNELVTSYLPVTTDLRRCREWHQPQIQGPCQVRLSFHEAGHVVLMERLLGLTTGLKATVTPTNGLAYWPHGVFDSIGEPEPDPSGILAATAASVYHAGLMAEMLHAGTPWRSPVFYPDQDDYRQADAMLLATFGRHASGAHAFAQKVALSILTDHWERVQEIASHLVEHGQWASE